MKTFDLTNHLYFTILTSIKVTGCQIHKKFTIFEMDQCTKVFLFEGLVISNSANEISPLSEIRKFRSFFGVSPNVCTIIWHSIDEIPSGANPVHLLWCLVFLKRYNTEHINAALVNADEKTFRLWTWTFVELLSKLKVVFSMRITSYVL